MNKQIYLRESGIDKSKRDSPSSFKIKIKRKYFAL